VIIGLLAGCHREPAPPPALEIAAPAAPPAGAESITCRVGPKQVVLALDDAGLHLRFVTARGNTVAMFGQSVVAGDPADTTLADAIAHVADERAGAEWMDVLAKVTSPAGQSAIVKVSLHVDRAMAKRLDAAAGAPVLFHGETPTSAKKVAWVHPEEGSPYVMGAGRWRDVDVVAIEHVTHQMGKTCGTDPEANGFVTIVSGHEISHVELYDRRAGKRIDETTIDGPQLCPNERDAAMGFSNDAAVRAWVGSKLAR
jgi:hypothetical protein